MITTVIYTFYDGLYDGKQGVSPYHNNIYYYLLVGGPAQATAAPTGTELQQEDTLKTPVAKKKLDVLLSVEVTPEINDEAMQGHLGSDFDDNEPVSTLGVPACGSPSPAKKKRGTNV